MFCQISRSDGTRLYNAADHENRYFVKKPTPLQVKVL